MAPLEMTPEYLALNVIAKSYSSEIISHLYTAATSLCPGCIEGKFGRIHHPICLSSIPDQIFYCADILPGMINEKAVDDNILSYMAQLKMSLSPYSQELFDVEERRKLLDNGSFWETIIAFCLPWTGNWYEKDVDKSKFDKRNDPLTKPRTPKDSAHST